MLKKITGAFLVALGAATAANAAVPVYSTPGTINSDSYSFTKLTSGDLVVTFLGATAGYKNVLGVIAGGTNLGARISNKVEVGTTYNFGYVEAGTTLDFYIKVLNIPGLRYSSDTSLNGDGYSHIFAASYAGGAYVGFEDRTVGNGDWDYDDATYVFADVGLTGPVSTVPEPATWAMMIAGFGLVGFASRRRRKIA